MKKDNFDEHGKQIAYLQGKYDAMKEALHKSKDKVASTGISVFQLVTASLLNKILTGLLIAGIIFGGYYYIAHKINETVTDFKQDVKESIPHPIDSIKKWFELEKKIELKDENRTSFKQKIKNGFGSLLKKKKENNETELIAVKQKRNNIEKPEVKQDENRTFFRQKLKKVLKSLFKKKENNETKELLGQSG